ncbi:helix-turn-helix domain-containing GNAT family N-acetyltransferase [Marinomonas sp. 15G1-11]|uniref:Helix-turn-helix domain-containing GNAT family N-acetyltransferase n=1 Tax=Marinomonas phaeophyticola TaxID=3004091 RepID=A0ABT4JR12_9GAMM|nr:helix-turn-helix domain-containing GNAT family N-acetyltransferase [Marinomonas sp. 15G1-11]MCZ2720452.1 helix-turn-helix domain-containing GNAT family N-acetyltransferase [Marinomonas sp. 15G1-11]
MEQFGVLTLGSRLKRLSDRLFLDVQELYMACKVPISGTYFPILKLLQVSGPLSVVEVASELRLSHPAISKQVAKMIKEDLLDKIIDTKDSRRFILTLSVKGQLAMLKAEPVLNEIKFVLEQTNSLSQGDFLTTLKQFEDQLMAGELCFKVLDRLNPIKIIPFDSAYLDEFNRINLAWLTRFFPTQITESERLLLKEPQEKVINKGGSVWLAISDRPESNRLLGAVIVLPTSSPIRIEMAKLSVVDHAQKMGVAQTLMDTVITYAKDNDIKIISLETSSRLTQAQNLYLRNGFIEKAHPTVSSYERADIYMEKYLFHSPNLEMKS